MRFEARNAARVRTKVTRQKVLENGTGSAARETVRTTTKIQVARPCVEHSCDNIPKEPRCSQKGQQGAANTRTAQYGTRLMKAARTLEMSTGLAAAEKPSKIPDVAADTCGRTWPSASMESPL